MERARKAQALPTSESVAYCNVRPLPFDFPLVTVMVIVVNARKAGVRSWFTTAVCIIGGNDDGLSGDRRLS